MKDRLKEIWDRQQNFDNIVLKKRGKTKSQVANEIKVALITEIGELYNENPTFKFWKEQKNIDRKSTRLNSSHANISYAVFCLKKKNKKLIESLIYQMNKYITTET